MPFLFTYGTLQDPQVQQYVFGRKLKGQADGLPGHEWIRNAVYNKFPLVKPSKSSTEVVEGMVYEVSDEELHRCDVYETSAYKREIFKLTSETHAWVYVENSD